MVAVESPDLVLADEGDRDVTVVDPGRLERGPRRLPQLGVVLEAVDLDLRGQDPVCLRVAGRSPGACFSAYSL